MPPEAILEKLEVEAPPQIKGFGEGKRKFFNSKPVEPKKEGAAPQEVKAHEPIKPPPETREPEKRQPVEQKARGGHEGGELSHRDRGEKGRPVTQKQPREEERKGGRDRRDFEERDSWKNNRQDNQERNQKKGYRGRDYYEEEEKGEDGGGSAGRGYGGGHRHVYRKDTQEGHRTVT